MIYAYLIEDVRALSDLFRVGVKPKKSANGLFTAYRVRHPESGARRALIVSGVSKASLRQEIPASVGREIKIDTNEGQLFWFDEAGTKQPVDVLGVSKSPQIEHLISPQPWRQELDLQLPIIFWLHDPALMPEIVRRSLYLNNDRVQIATLEHDDGTQGMLVRIEAPSYYLVAWCQEQGDARVELFYPMTEGQGLYAQWGYEHPLADLWRRAWLEQSESWAFFPAGGDRRVMPKPQWQSLYELASFKVDLSEDEAWTQINQDTARFDIALKLAPRHEPSPLEVVVLREDERERIEDFLSLSDAQDAERIEISAQQDEQGGHWFFLRERHRGDGVALTEFGGQGFSRYRGFENLFLPVNLVLEPQLRRDQYKRLFDLDSGSLTFVMPQDGGPGVTIKVRKRTFEPLSNFVDHIVQFEHQALEALLDSSIFDFELYKLAPSNPNLTRSGGDAPDRSKPRKQATKQDIKRKVGPKPVRAPAVEKTTKPNPAAQQVEEAPALTPTELELQETALERSIVMEGPLSHLWLALMQVKALRELWHESAVCAVEGLWSQTFSEVGLTPTVQDPEVVAALIEGYTYAIDKAGQQPASKATVASVLSMDAAQAQENLSAVMEGSSNLRSAEKELGKKDRWLAWRKILSLTRDVRAQEEVREHILKELNEKGLETRDAAAFVRERILKDPDLEFGHSDSDGDDSSFVLQNVEVIEEAIGRMQTHKIKVASMASLARVMGGLGLNARSRALIEQALEQMQNSLSAHDEAAPTDQPWHERVKGFLRKIQSSDESTTRPERWHVWVALNAWLIYQRAEPSRADEARKAYEVMFNQLPDYEKEELQRTAESLEARIGQSNVTAFLAEDTRSFFSSKDLPDKMSKVVRGLRTAQVKGDEKTVNDLVLQGVAIANQEIPRASNPETVARLILEMVEVIRKLKWTSEMRPVDAFEAFVKTLPKEPADPNSSRLYFAVLHCAAARAMMDLGREKEAMDMITYIMNWVGQDFMQVLDFVDLVKKEILLAVELAPRNQRTEALRTLMNTLIIQETMEIGTDPANKGMSFELPFQAYELIQMIDHTLEAAVSNEKLVLRRLRDWEEREETRIRHWVQRDQPALPS